MKFHDGSDFTADDVVFSFGRIVQPQGTMQIYVTGVKEVVKVDDHTVDFILSGPVPILLRNIVDFRIMSKSWAEKNRSQNVQDYAKKEETYASRNTNGTGPYIIKGWEPDKQIVLTQNKNWWGKLDGNVSDVVYNPIKSDATRVSALLAGDVDLVTDLPVQDVERLRKEAKLKVLDGHEVRTIFIGMDQHRDELQYSNVKGKNPFKDVRVRRALNMAVDREAIKRVVMRGMSIPAGIMVAPGVHGLLQGHRRGDEARPGRREEAARRGRLSRRLRVHARLPEQPLRERRADLPGAGRHVGQGRRARAAERDAVRDLHPQDPELRLERLHAGLGRGDLRRALHAPVAGAHQDRRRGRQLQPRPHLDPKLDTTIDAIKIATDPKARDALLREGWSRRATSTTTCRSTTSCGRGR